ncbi:hypothetical protein DFJ73DRAFT_340751 [Zopfochytrium polystomum]|nr:hypothetical protein DFJ73DRAFT_340751 [Zopfochytrium polystomum]
MQLFYPVMVNDHFSLHFASKGTLCIGLFQVTARLLKAKMSMVSVAMLPGTKALPTVTPALDRNPSMASTRTWSSATSLRRSEALSPTSGATDKKAPFSSDFEQTAKSIDVEPANDELFGGMWAKRKQAQATQNDEDYRPLPKPPTQPGAASPDYNPFPGPDPKKPGSKASGWAVKAYHASKSDLEAAAPARAVSPNEVARQTPPQPNAIAAGQSTASSIVVPSSDHSNGASWTKIFNTALFSLASNLQSMKNKAASSAATANAFLNKADGTTSPTTADTSSSSGGSNNAGLIAAVSILAVLVVVGGVTGGWYYNKMNSVHKAVHGTPKAPQTEEATPEEVTMITKIAKAQHVKKASLASASKPANP